MDKQGRGQQRGTDKIKERVSPDRIVPDPPAVLHVTPFVWPAGIPIHRIHLSQYVSYRFNPGIRGNARFSPIVDFRGASVPTLYGGSSFDYAAIETVFHDVPFSPGFKSFDKRKLQRQCIPY